MTNLSFTLSTGVAVKTFNFTLAPEKELTEVFRKVVSAYNDLKDGRASLVCFLDEFEEGSFCFSSQTLLSFGHTTKQEAREST